MFRRRITETPLTTVDANAVFSKITGSSYDDDVSFVATLRAVLHDVEGAEVDFCFFNSDRSVQYISTDARSTVSKIISSESLTPHRLILINFDHRDKDAADDWVKAMRGSFSEAHPRFKKVTNFATMFARAFETDCFVDSENKTTVLFTARIDTMKYHYIQSAILAMVPWYVDRDSPFLSEKITFCAALGGINSKTKKPLTKDEAYEIYTNYLTSVASRYDFETAKVKRLLTGIEKVVYEREISAAESSVSRLREKIEQYNANLSTVVRDLNITLAKLAGLKLAAEEKNGNELMDYFLSNKAMDLRNVCEDRIEFVAKGYAFCDPDYAKSVIENRRSFIHAYAGGSISAETMVKIMTKIFVNAEWKLRFCAAYELAVGSRVRGIEDYSFGSAYDTYMPNPHIDNHACLGGYNETMSRALQEGNNLSALEQCIASAVSLNFGDSTVMEEFMKSFYGRSSRCQRSNPRCIELPDGRVVTPKEAAEIIEKEEKEDEQTD